MIIVIVCTIVHDYMYIHTYMYMQGVYSFVISRVGLFIFETAILQEIAKDGSIGRAAGKIWMLKITNN